MEDSSIAKLIATAKALWPSWTTAPQSGKEFEVYVGAWRTQLGDLDERFVLAGLSSLSSDGREFVPPVGLLRQTAIEMQRKAEGTGLPTADEALREVKAAIDEHGSYGSPRWSHRVIRDCVNAIGWREICMSQSPDTVRAHFLKMYAERAKVWNREDVAPPIVNELLMPLMKSLGTVGK